MCLHKVLFANDSRGVNNTNGFFVHLDTIALVCIELIRAKKPIDDSLSSISRKCKQEEDDDINAVGENLFCRPFSFSNRLCLFIQQQKKEKRKEKKNSSG